MSAFAEFYESIRLLLGDQDADARLFEDTQLDAALRMGVRLLGALGYGYTLVLPGRTEITPDVNDPNDWMLLCYRACFAFTPSLCEATSFRTRAFTETRGGRKELLWVLETELYRLENRSLFSSWTDLATWASALEGADPVVRMAQMRQTGVTQTQSYPS